MIDKSSPKLSLFCSNGTHIKKVTMELCKSGKVFHKHTLTSVLVSSYRLSPGGGASTPQENVTLNFASMQTST